LASRAALTSKYFYFWNIAPKLEIGISKKIMCLEASTKPHVHQKFEIFWTNMASTMACPNFKNGPKNGLRHLGINQACGQ
jgi:hypothetical protein